MKFDFFVKRFLDDGNTTLLSANIEKLADGGHKIHLDNSAHVRNTDDKVRPETS